MKYGKGKGGKIHTAEVEVESGSPTQPFSLPPSLAAAPFSGLLTVSAAAILQQARKAGGLGAADSLQPEAFSPAHCGLRCCLPCTAVPLGSHLFILMWRLACY